MSRDATAACRGHRSRRLNIRGCSRPPFFLVLIEAPDDSVACPSSRASTLANVRLVTESQDSLALHGAGRERKREVTGGRCQTAAG